jgi:CRP-like cAMP-binding protein
MLDSKHFSVQEAVSRALMNLLSTKQSYKNRVLACLPKSELKRLEPHLEAVNLPVDETLIAAGEKVRAVYFLEQGLCSIVVEMKGGSTVEVGLIGKEGVVGASSVLGAEHAPNRGFIQVAGSGFRIDLNKLQEQTEGSRELRACLQKSMQGLQALTAQTAACNRVHELPERLAKWLLTAHDRVESDRIPITHEFLGMMLGTGRPTVTLAAGTLQKAGLIVYSRGHVTIKDRKGLEAVACECYQTVHDEYLRLGLLDGNA